MRQSTGWTVAAAVVLAAGLLAYMQRGVIGMKLIEHEVRVRASDADPLKALPDGLHVGLCGAGSPLPDERRGGPCHVVVAGRRMFVIDAGSGAPRRIVQMRLNVGQVEALFVTHYHSDHIDGMGELMLQRWAQGAHRQSLPIYGPPGLGQVLDGFHGAYALDRGYRIAHHGEQLVPPSGAGGTAHEFELDPQTGRRVLISEPDLEVAAFAVQHEPVHPAVGYRIRYKDRVVVFSGDTAQAQAVARESRGADVLIHEALSAEMVGMFERSFREAGRANLAHVMHDILGYHTTPEEAAELARQAGVRALVFSHIIPVLPPGMEEVFSGKAAQIFHGPIHVGVDGDWITLPAGSPVISIGRRS